jgi:hypothetical protein
MRRTTRSDAAARPRFTSISSGFGSIGPREASQPVVLKKHAWERNPTYPVERELTAKSPSDYNDLGLRPAVPIWQQYLDNPEAVMWVPQPERADHLWSGFVP